MQEPNCPSKCPSTRVMVTGLVFDSHHLKWSGAKGTRTPGLLHAMGRAAVHRPATCQLEMDHAVHCRAGLRDDGQIPVKANYSQEEVHIVDDEANEGTRLDMSYAITVGHECRY